LSLRPAAAWRYSRNHIEP